MKPLPGTPGTIPGVGIIGVIIGMGMGIPNIPPMGIFIPIPIPNGENISKRLRARPSLQLRTVTAIGSQRRMILWVEGE